MSTSADRRAVSLAVSVTTLLHKMFLQDSLTNTCSTGLIIMQNADILQPHIFPNLGLRRYRGLRNRSTQTMDAKGVDLLRPQFTGLRSTLLILPPNGVAEPHRDTTMGLKQEILILEPWIAIPLPDHTNYRVLCFPIFVTPIIVKIILWKAWLGCIMFFCIKKSSVLTCKHLWFPMVFLYLIYNFSHFKYIGRLKLWKQPGLLLSSERPSCRVAGELHQYRRGLLATRDDDWKFPGI